MSFTLDMQKGDGVLLFTSYGRLRNLQDLLDYISAIMRECERHDGECILLDERELALSLTLQDMFIFAEEKAIDLRFGLDNKCVSVCSRDNMELMDAGALFLRNRNIEFKVFPDMGAAREWLAVLAHG